jgi:ATP-binding cassette subfamily F protein uup
MPPPLITLHDIALTFGGTPLLTHADLVVEAGERICLVGRNGSGKSTLLKIVAGLVEPDGGERFVHPNATVRYLAQETDFSGHATALAWVEAGLAPGDDPYRARQLLDELGLAADAHPDRLSGGEARRLALARVLAPRPDVLLLDEPTNHLDLPAIEWLEAHLVGLKSAILMVSHDRRFLETLSRATVWLDRGETRRLEQGFARFEAWRDEVYAQDESERHKLDRRIAREDQWMHGGVTARRKRNVRRVRELAALRQQRKEERKAVGNVRLAAAEGALSGRLVIEAEGISKGYGPTPLVQGFSTRILRGDRVGIVGPNGAGKTTLLNLLTGALAPDAGRVRLGANLQMVSLDQRRDELRPEWTVADALTGGRGDQVVINGKARHVASYMKDFLFLPEQARSPLSVLSGGERGRLMLARALAKPSNLLVLDEPTNDLDLETLDLLQELLADYAGTVLLVSHDRDFLDRIVTSVIAAEGDGRWTEYAGGYSDMLAQRRGADLARAPVQADKSKPPQGPAPTDPPATSPPRKLSFKEKHALATLPARLDCLANEIAALEAALADASLYARDPAAFGAATARLAALSAELAAAEEQWLELELLREKLERA